MTARQDFAELMPTSHRGAWAGLRFASAFQPIFSLTHNRIVGHEALLRAHDAATGAAMPPAELFARASGRDEAVALDRIAFERHLGSYGSIGAPAAPQWLFLNVDPASVMAPDGLSAARVAAALALHGIPATRVVVEVLESPLAASREFQQRLFGLRDIGCLVAVDDFGAGHSNFERVFALRPDIVKLDRAVVERAVGSAHLRRITAQTVSLLHECGALVLMEGIETSDGAYAALCCDVDFVQGYHFGRPAPALASPGTGRAELDAAWARFDAESTRDDTAWRQRMAPYAAALEHAGRLYAAGATLDEACVRFLELPEAHMCYVLDGAGLQALPKVFRGGPARATAGEAPQFAPLHDTLGGRWSRRPYFRQARPLGDGVHVTHPYLTLQGSRMCATVSVRVERDGHGHVLCGDASWVGDD